jgi:hypothetical protein
MAWPCCTHTQRAATGSARSRKEKVIQHHAIKTIVHALYKVRAGVGSLKHNLSASQSIIDHFKTQSCSSTAQPDAANALWASCNTRSKERCARGGIDWA